MGPKFAETYPWLKQTVILCFSRQWKLDGAVTKKETHIPGWNKSVICVICVSLNNERRESCHQRGDPYSWQGLFSQEWKTDEGATFIEETHIPGWNWSVICVSLYNGRQGNCNQKNPPSLSLLRGTHYHWFVSARDMGFLFGDSSLSFTYHWFVCGLPLWR